MGRPTAQPTSSDTDNEELSSSQPIVREELHETALKKVVKKSSITTVIVSGVALFSDGYAVQIGTFSYMELIFAALYKEALTATVKARLSNSFLVGEIFGMLVFGAVIDRLGRRTGVVWATVFLVLGIVLATASHGSDASRGIPGFGAGGEHPTCAAGTVEATDESPTGQRRRGIFVSLSTIFVIDLGNVVSGIVAIIVLVCYRKEAHEGIWRICFGIGVILPVAVFIFCFRMINSTQYRKHAIKSNVPYREALKWYWKPLLGSILTWFCYDFIRYPLGLFSAPIIAGFNPEGTILESIGYGTLVNTFYLPGTILGGILVDKIGRRQTMTLGFVCLAVFGFIIGGTLPQLQKVFPAFVVLYGIFNASGEMGPGSTVFLLSSEPFPTPLRGHFLGLASAGGKVGAVVGTQVFDPIVGSFDTVQQGQRAGFLIGSAFAVLGAICAWFLFPDLDISLESEATNFERNLKDSGYSSGKVGETMDSNLKSSIYEAAEVIGP